MYAEGQGVEQNPDLAKQFFIKAARKDSEKQIPIGKRFLYGDGVEQNFKLAQQCLDLVHSNEKLFKVAETYKEFAKCDESTIYEDWALGKAGTFYALVASCCSSEDLEANLEVKARCEIQEVRRMRTELLESSIKNKIPELD